MPDWKKMHEEISRELQRQNPDKQIFWARHDPKTIQSHELMEKFEIHKVSGEEAKRIGLSPDGGSSDGLVKLGDLVVMSRPKEMQVEHQRELREKNKRLIEGRRSEDERELRKTGVKPTRDRD